MLLYTTPAEGLAWLLSNASDEDLAAFDALTFASAAERARAEAAEEDDSAT